MGSPENVRHHRPVLDAVKGFCAQDCRVDTYLAGPPQLWRELPIRQARPDRRLQRASTGRRAHVAGPSCHVGGTLAVRHGWGHLLRLGS